MEPLVLEGSLTPKQQFIFESQWDAFALIDALGEQSDTRIIITRGASNGSLVVPFNLPLPTTLIMQNDEEKNGKVPAEVWADKVEATLIKAPTRKLYPPKKYKDLNDWIKAIEGNVFDELQTWLTTKPETQKKTIRYVGTPHYFGMRRKILMHSLVIDGCAKVVAVCGLEAVGLGNQF